MADDIVVTRIRDRVYRVVADGRAEIVYVAGSASDTGCSGMAAFSAATSAAPPRPIAAAPARSACSR